MSEPIKHGSCIYDPHDQIWWYASGGVPDGFFDMIVSFDPEDGTRLNADGTVTPMVERVTSEAVREATVLLRESPLVRQFRDYSSPDVVRLVAALDTALAALSQATGLAAAEWLAGVATQLEKLIPPIERGEVLHTRHHFLSAALAAVGAEPGPSDKPEEADHARD